MTFTIEFADCIKEQFKYLNASQRSTTMKGIKKHLSFEPLNETKNRKHLRPNTLAPLELRLEELRVFYEVNPEEPSIVNILAVDYKKGNILFIGGKVVEL